MPPRRKLSLRQLEMLVEFAESHKDVCLGRFSGGPMANQAAKQAWENISNRLNAIADGVIKTPDQWRRYWIEFKAKVKGKGADIRRNATATGGGPSKLLPLTDIEERVLALIGPVAVEGLSGVRIPLEVVYCPSAEPATPQESWREEILHSPLPQTPQSGVQEQFEFPGSSRVQEEEEEIERDFLGLDHDYHQATTSALETATPRPTPATRAEDAQLNRRDRVPRWAYDLESRRLANEERIATSLESLILLMRDIRNDIRDFIARND